MSFFLGVKLSEMKTDSANVDKRKQDLSAAEKDATAANIVRREMIVCVKRNIQLYSVHYKSIRFRMREKRSYMVKEQDDMKEDNSRLRAEVLGNVVFTS